MGGTRTRPRDAREKRNKRARRRRNIKGSTACDGDVEDCKEKGYEQGTRVGRTEKLSGGRTTIYGSKMCKSLRKKDTSKGHEWEGRKSNQEGERLSKDQRCVRV
ncbi:uncharacterized protein [Oscarella lobularis]|uniref:uncharacterized protein isoform X3 n=1 Tax=Oscarella lobularis TaxID=121494 RepID=UPI0033142382